MSSDYFYLQKCTHRSSTLHSPTYSEWTPSGLRAVRVDSEDCPRTVRSVRVKSEQSEDSPKTVRGQSEQSELNRIFYYSRTELGLCSDFARTLLGLCSKNMCFLTLLPGVYIVILYTILKHFSS
jgi:hypothetical protein